MYNVPVLPILEYTLPVRMKAFVDQIFKFLVFRQGDEGTSWYIILHGSVKVDVLGKVSLTIFKI